MTGAEYWLLATNMQAGECYEVCVKGDTFLAVYRGTFQKVTEFGSLQFEGLQLDARAGTDLTISRLS